MIYKPFFLIVMFALFIGVNNTSAQCECIGDIETAVADVMATSFCDDDGLWEAPHALEVHLKKLQNWCGDKKKPLKSKVPNIVEGMLETIDEAFAGEGYPNPLNPDETIWIHIPAPPCATGALTTLQGLLLNGCPE